MQIYPLEMLERALLTLALGAVLGIYYDVLTALKTCIFNNKAEKYGTFLRDLLFLLTFTLIFILVLYYFNNGTFRALFLGADMLGIFIYKVTLSKSLLKLMLSLLSVIGRLLRLIVKPVVLLFGKIKNSLHFSFHPIAKIKERLYNKKGESAPEF